MELIVYNGTEDFLEDNRVILESKALELNLFWRNIKSGKTLEDGLFSAKVSHYNGCMIAIRQDPCPMVLYSQGTRVNSMADKLIQHLNKSPFPKNVNGQPSAVTAFTEQCKKHGKHYRQKRLLDLMVCSRLRDIDSSGHELRYIKDVDFDLSDYFYDFHKECNIDITRENAAKMAEYFRKSNLVLCNIVGKDVVSMAMTFSPIKTAKATCLGFVYTPRIYRNKGYSTACVKKLVSDSFEKGYEKVFLYAEDPAAIRVYKKIGFFKVGELKECELK